MAKRIRSFTKAMTWRICGSSANLFIVYLFTENIAISGVVGISDFLFKTFAYYFHERIWAKIEWGRSYEHENIDPD